MIPSENTAVTGEKRDLAGVGYGVRANGCPVQLGTPAPASGVQFPNHWKVERGDIRPSSHNPGNGNAPVVYAQGEIACTIKRVNYPGRLTCIDGVIFF